MYMKSCFLYETHSHVPNNMAKYGSDNQTSTFIP